MSAKLDQMWEVHGRINKLTYVSDTKKYKRDDFWADITDAGNGDCEDYAIAKLHALQMLGWDIALLRLACCYIEPDGVTPLEDRYHAVLLVEVPGEGVWMLDNRLEVPVPIEKLPELEYTPDCVQAVGGQPGWKEWLP